MRSLSLAVFALLGAAAAGSAAAMSSDSGGLGRLPLGYQPNIVFILTDDQDRVLGRTDAGYTTLGSLDAMPTVKKELIGDGAFFEHGFVNTPICCPSRTETITGRYYQNVLNADRGGCMHVNAAANVFNTTGSMFSLMEKAGYAVGVMGKVTNDQGHAYWDPKKPSTWKADGMTHIDSPIDYNDYDGTTYFRKFANGTMHVETLNPSNPRFNTTYQTAQIGNRTLEWLDSLTMDKPFFAYIGPHAPHFPAEPAPWYAHAFDDTLTAPRLPNYNVSSPFKPEHIRQNPPLSDDVKCWEDQHMRDRWATLLSVDDIVSDVMDNLRSRGVLERTVFVYSSDHGYKLGSWRIGTSKQHPYETDIRVPLLVRGPGIKAGSLPSMMVGNVDITPTLLELAGAAQPTFMDGKSFVHAILPDRLPEEEVASRTASWRDTFLTSYLSVGTYWNDHSAIWHDNSSGPSGSWECSASTHGPRSPPGDHPAKCIPAAAVGAGTCYYLDSTASNSWRALRIMNDTANWQYVEYDPTFDFKHITLHELYDLSADPFQLHNIYNTTSSDVKSSLAASLASYYECKGTASTPSNCP